EVVAWQAALWKVVPIGSYRYGNTVRQVANDPAAGTKIPKLDIKPPPDRPPAEGYEDFRRCFPQFICFPQVIPTDEVVSLKMYHREDEPLLRLFLDAEQTRRINHL